MGSYLSHQMEADRQNEDFLASLVLLQEARIPALFEGSWNSATGSMFVQGRKGSRPKGVDEKKRQAAISLSKDKSRSVKEICEILGIARNTYYKYTRQPKAEPVTSAK